jgi:hypothetical protein
MRSISNLIVKTTPRDPAEKRYSGPVACAFFIGALAIAVTGGTLWLTSSVVHNNAQAASLFLASE